MQYFHMFIQCFYYTTCSISTCIYVSAIPRAVFPRVYMFLLFHVQYFHVYICFYYSTCSISTCIYVSTIPHAVFPRVYMFLLFHVQYFHVYICFYYSTCSISTCIYVSTIPRAVFPRGGGGGPLAGGHHVQHAPHVRTCARGRSRRWPSGHPGRNEGTWGEGGCGTSDTFNTDILSLSYHVIISPNRAKHTTILQWKVYVHL